MPATSKAMFRAMQAAKHGHSNLGIPAKVGAEFVDATDAPGELPERKPTRGEERREHGKQYHLKRRGHGLQRANR